MPINPGENAEYIIVGLGNPGKNYENTRHNIGFKIIDYIDENAMLSRGCKKMMHCALTDKCVVDGRVVFLVKPQTYMNNSGMAVKDVMFYYKLPTSKLIVIHDDITLPVGHFKIKKGGSAGGHNGIKSIIEHLGTNDFIHIKVGIGKKPTEWELANYVLGRIPEDEFTLMKSKFETIKEAISTIFNYGLEKAMNQYNPIGAGKADN